MTRMTKKEFRRMRRIAIARGVLRALFEQITGEPLCDKRRTRRKPVRLPDLLK